MKIKYKIEFELKDTIELMLSEDYKERFIGEYIQAVIRYKKLNLLLLKDEIGKLEFDITGRRSILEDQLFTMQEYVNILTKRAILENIELPKI